MQGGRKRGPDVPRPRSGSVNNEIVYFSRIEGKKSFIPCRVAGRQGKTTISRFCQGCAISVSLGIEPCSLLSKLNGIWDRRG